jgi:RNA polymerase sigma-70 factor (ECF subfamily)
VQATDEYRWLFRQEYRSVVWTVNVVLSDYARSEEVAQDAFLRLLEKWDKVSRYDRPGAWVRRVAIRMAVRADRREQVRRRRERTATAGRDAGADMAEVVPRDAALMDAIRQLPAKQRAAVALHYLEDRPVQEVADLLDCAPATVSVHLHRARQRLAETLGEGVESHVD